MSDRQIQEQIDELFGCKLSPDMISDITDKIIPEIQDWQKRKLDKTYAVLFIDAIHFSVKDNGQVVKKAAYIILRGKYGRNERSIKYSNWRKRKCENVVINIK